MIRLLLADDHTLLREGLKQLFALTVDIAVCAEATQGVEVLAALNHAQFDVILLDMAMPGLAGADLIVRILALPAPPPILVLSMHNEQQIVRRALMAGASGYLTKDSDPAVLLSAVRKVATGGRFIDPVLAESMAFAVHEAAAPCRRHDSLSQREHQIFQLIAAGVGINAIALQLGISNKTVSTHKARLMEKMGFVSHTDLVRYAILHGLAE